MKMKFTVQKQVQVPNKEIEDKISIFFKNKFYKVTEIAPGYITFSDDMLSSRTTSKSDYYNRIEEGKIEIITTNEGIEIKLIFLVPVTYEVLVTAGIGVAGIYIHSFIGLVFIPIVINFIYKIYNIKTKAFNEICACLTNQTPQV